MGRKDLRYMVATSAKTVRDTIADCALVLLKETTDNFAQSIWDIIGEDVIAFLYSYVENIEETGDFSMDDMAVAIGHALLVHLANK